MSTLDIAKRIISAAISQVGKPYKFGAEAPGVDFDCSGLTQWAYRQAGLTIPRVAAQQQAATQRISKAELQPGDLVFYGNPAHHVAIYLGQGRIIQAPHTGAVIDIVPMGNATNYGRVKGQGQLTGGAQQGSVGGSNSPGGINAGPTAQHESWKFPGWLSFLGGLSFDVLGGGSVPSTIGDISQAIEDLVNAANTVVKWLTWLFNPANWLRIGAAVAGVALLVAALLFLRKAIAPAAPSLPPGMGGAWNLVKGSQ